MEQLKKYRSAVYDSHAEIFSEHMKLYKLPDDFHIFTERLMDEPKINRNSLLNAIDDYNNTDFPKKHPLPMTFKVDAYNFYPYQPCVFC